MDRSEGFQRQLSKTKTQLKASKPQQAFLLSVFYAMTPHLTYALFLHGQEEGMDDNSEVVREVRDIPQWNLNPTLSVTCSVPQSFRTKIPKSSPPWRFCCHSAKDWSFIVLI